MLLVFTDSHQKMNAEALFANSINTECFEWLFLINGDYASASKILDTSDRSPIKGEFEKVDQKHIKIY